MIRSIRVKLALWYAGTLAAGITTLGWFTYSYVARETTAQPRASSRCSTG